MHGLCHYLVKEVYEAHSGLCFRCVAITEKLNDSDSYFNSYEMINGFCRKIHPWLEGSSGYSMNFGGLNGDGYDYLEVVERAAQGSLF